MKNEDKDKFMRMAIRLSVENVELGGGPFAAIIVKKGEVIASGTNRVTLDNDPTAHAEVNAIRNACKKLDRYDLSGCEIFSSCEPCPMCLSAIYWAHLDKLYYGNTKEDARQIGFSDQFIYEELALKPTVRKLESEKRMREEALEAFKAWSKKEDKTEY
ncbi:MAG: nucleoside deaminase [Bacteroidales bacterium]